MDIIQLAKILQLAGFLLAGIFGGILLDELVGGRVAKWFTSVFVGFVDRLREIMQAEEEYGIGWEDLKGYILVLLGVGWLTVLMIGWLGHISILLWIGVGLYCTQNMVYLVLRLLSFRRHSIEVQLALFVPMAVSGLIWLWSFVAIILLGLLVVARSVMRKLGNPRTPKAAFTVLGFLILLTGLVIDAIAAF